MWQRTCLNLHRLCFLSFFFILGSLAAAKPSSFQYRFSAGADWDFRPDWELNLQQSLRHLEGQGGIYYRASDVGIVYSGLAPWLDVGLSFKAQFKENASGETFGQNRPYLNVVFHGDLQRFEISNRVRLEYRDNEAKPDLWRSRNLLKIGYLLQAGTWEVTPYLADEVFLNMDSDGDYSNRITLGTSATPNERVSLRLYHFWESKRTKRVRAVGLALKFHF